MLFGGHRRTRVWAGVECCAHSAAHHGGRQEKNPRPILISPGGRKIDEGLGVVGVWELRVSFSCALCLASPSPRIAAELEKACRVWYRGCDIITVRMRRGMYGGKGDRETEGTPWLKDAPPNRFVPWCYTACGVGFWGMLFILELKPCQLAGLWCAVGGLRGSFFFLLSPAVG